MRIVFLGSPASVVAPLKTLLTEGHHVGHEVVGVVSQPPRAVGRKKTLQDPPVAEYAREQGLPLLQPERVTDPGFQEQFCAWQPDVAVTAAYGQILPADFLSLPPHGVLNIHPSLLPAYRGATPVPATLRDGHTRTGVTILYTVQKVDAGPIVLRREYPIGEHETAGELTERLFQESGPLMIEALSRLDDPTFEPEPQDESQATFSGKIRKADGLIDWSRSAEEIYNRFRAHAPWPGSFTFLNDRRIVITGMEPARGNGSLEPGAIEYDRDRQRLIVGTGDGRIAVSTVKPEGKGEQRADAFANGLPSQTSTPRFAVNP